MSASRAVLSLSEQIFASGFNFLLFLCVARLLSGEELGIFTAMFSLNQSFSFFLFGLVLFPVSSASGADTPKQIGIALVLLVILLLGFALLAPLTTYAFDSLKDQASLQLWVLSVSFFAGQCCYEVGRWLCIRLHSVLAALPVTLLRFVSFFTALYLLSYWQLNAGHVIVLQTCISLTAVGFYVWLLRGFRHEIVWALPDRVTFKHLATFGNSVVSFVANFIVVSLVDRGLGGGGLAAFQAIRSATNPIGLVSQVLDNHFSAEFSRSGQRMSFHKHILLVAVSGAILLFLLSFIFAREITDILFAGRFSEYWILVPLLFLASLCHALTRPVFVSWRVSNSTKSLNTYSFLILIIVMPVLIITGLTGHSYVMIGVFALLPMTALLIELIRHPAENGRLTQ
ncbi:hypothetical protein SAMN05444141_106163 [Pseudovibrio denitrificans]|uniref:Membrane protein involved in the export of O-antigen and teichoic acid n=1 Tax=Pseudovibrio denitrificans TaxID=258256 RepID=A0A1I7CMY3_9HYPH|nr:hypothetical protein [Pseudovibrio denitrificans]SFU00728.1 hypothetical protein SAMN05444141_106163 [Pseudovibrio denitrificans]